METKIERISRQINPILKQAGVTRAGLFGSVIRNEEHANSDVDLLVELKDQFSLLDFIGLKQQLEDKLTRKVDLVEYKSVKPQLKGSILGNVVQIL